MVLDEQRRQRYLEKLDQLEFNFTVSKDGLNKLAIKKFEILEIYGVLHGIQLTIEALTDISAMTVKDLNKLAKNNYENLSELQSQGIITNKIKNSLYKLVGLRNRIAHDYNGLDDKLALKSFEENIPSIQIFIEGLKQWIKKK